MKFWCIITYYVFPVINGFIKNPCMFTPDKLMMPNCSADEFQCSDGKCLPNFLVCNGVKNCENDEESCDYIKCGPHYRKCDDGRQCIHKSKWCNKVPNCNDKSDEAFCFRK